MMHVLRRLLALATALALIRCGGGSGGGGSAAPGTQAPPPPTGSQLAQTAFTIVIPPATTTSAQAHAAIIPSDTQSIKIVITAVNGAPPPSGIQTTFTAPLTTSSSNCSQGTSGLACTIAVEAPVGSVTFAVSLYSTTDESGAAIASGVTTSNIVVGTSNTVNLTLALVGGTVVIALSTAKPPSGTSATIGVTVTEEDSGGGTITGTYANPVTLSDSDTSGATTLEVNGKAGTTVTSSSDVVTLLYSGLAIAPVTIGASTTSLASGTATLTPAIAPVVLSPTSLAFEGTASVGGVGASTVTASQAGWTGTYGHVITLSDGTPACNLASTTAHLVSVGSTSGTSFAITPQNVGTCSLNFTGGVGAVTALPITVTTTSVIIQSHGSTP